LRRLFPRQRDRTLRAYLDSSMVARLFEEKLMF
jgi:hypothetical protein